MRSRSHRTCSMQSSVCSSGSSRRVFEGSGPSAFTSAFVPRAFSCASVHSRRIAQMGCLQRFVILLTSSDFCLSLSICSCVANACSLSFRT